MSANGTLKPFFAKINGQEVLRKDGVYYLRYTDRHGKRHYQYAGVDPNHVRTLRSVREHMIAGEKLGLVIAEPPGLVRPPKPVLEHLESVESLVHPEAPPPDPSGTRLSLVRTIDKFVREMDVVRSRKRAAEYRHKLSFFVKTFKKTYIDEIESEDIVRYIGELRKRNLSTRTILNYCQTVRAFLQQHDYADRVPKRLFPKPTEKVVRAYSKEDLKAIFAAATPEEAILFRFFLELGMREREVMFASWRDIDFGRRLFHVTDKPDWEFTIKDKEERFIPIPSGLLAELEVRYNNRKHDRWIFPSDRRQPDGHMLRKLQKLAFRANLNCGMCLTKRGVSCKVAACCREFGLHKFRRTYATLHHENGVPVRTLMSWLGHSDMDTTIRYLASADPDSERTRMLVDKTWEMLA